MKQKGVPHIKMHLLFMKSVMARRMEHTCHFSAHQAEAGLSKNHRKKHCNDADVIDTH